MGMFTSLITSDCSDDLSLEGNRINIRRKTYTWRVADCGIHVKLSRSKTTSCGLCVESKHLKFLEDKGVDFIKRVNHNTYLVSLSCGHIKKVHPDESNFSTYCRECKDTQILNRCPEGTEIINYSNKGQYVHLHLPCGHDIKRKSYSDDTQIVCKECEADKKKSTLVNVKAIENNNGTYTLSCGHTTGLVSWNTLENYKCLSCEKDSILLNASYLGLKPTGNYNSEIHKHEFILECGHSKYLRTTAIKAGTVCTTCDDSHLNKPCDMYFLLGFAEDFTFLKIGIANDTKVRVNSFKSKNINAWFQQASIGFKTKREALAVEKKFHKDFAAKRIDSAVMKKYLGCGFTECYSQNVWYEIQDFVHEMQEKYGHSVHYKEVNLDDYR